MKFTPFHLAIQVRDIEESRDFYGTQKGFPEGRSLVDWIDWDMFGHQMVTHCNKSLGKDGKVNAIISFLKVSFQGHKQHPFQYALFVYPLKYRLSLQAPD